MSSPRIVARAAGVLAAGAVCGTAVVAAIVCGAGAVSLSAQAATGPSAGQQARGKATYLDKCSSCHQETLKGANDSPALTDDMFWMNWDGYNANNLLEQVRTTMPEDNPGGLERQAYVDVVAYILRVNGVELAGDLPSDVDALKKVVIKRKDP